MELQAAFLMQLMMLVTTSNQGHTVSHIPIAFQGSHAFFNTATFQPLSPQPALVHRVVPAQDFRFHCAEFHVFFFLAHFCRLLRAARSCGVEATPSRFVSSLYQTET